MGEQPSHPKWLVFTAEIPDPICSDYVPYHVYARQHRLIHLSFSANESIKHEKKEANQSLAAGVAHSTVGGTVAISPPLSSEP